MSLTQPEDVADAVTVLNREPRAESREPRAESREALVMFAGALDAPVDPMRIAPAA